MILIIGAAAAALVLLWIRARIYRNRFNRAMRAISRGGAMSRVTSLFWKATATAAFLVVAWAFVATHKH